MALTWDRSAAHALAAGGKSFKKSGTIFKLGVRKLFLITFLL